MSLTGRDGGLICVIAALFGKAEPAAGWAVPMQGNDTADARKHDQSLKRAGKR